jgi:hypothetical protein
MTHESKNSSADDLTKSKKPGDIQLKEKDLEQVSGGLKIDIDAEAADYKYKSE